jgi:outer membrane protein assembly factor BamB
MRFPLLTFAVTGAAALPLVRTAHAATTLTGLANKNAPVPSDHGSNAPGTPNITLEWDADWDQYPGWPNDPGDGVYQHDHGLNNPHTIVFTPDPGVNAIITQLDINVWSGSGETKVDWEIIGSSSGTLGSGTWTTADGAVSTYTTGITGTGSESLTLKLTQTSGTGSFLAIDNLVFDQVGDPLTTPEPTIGPFVRFDGGSGGTVCWQTADAEPSVIDYSAPGIPNRRISDATPKTWHELPLPDLAAKTEYTFTIVKTTDGAEASTPPYTFETDYRYEVPPIPDRPNPFPDDGQSPLYASVAQGLIDQTGAATGYALDFGATDARLAYEIVSRSRLNVILVSPDPATVATLRTQLHAAGIYGSRASVVEAPLDATPCTGKWFNLAFSSGLIGGTAMTGDSAELFRLLRPGGGVAVLGLPDGVAGELPPENDPESWIRAGVPADQATIEATENRATTVTRLPETDIGAWTHNFADSGQSCSSHDVRASSTDMHIQWFGNPGPRGITDRQARNPTPLVVNGTLYVQGNDRVSAQDSYNGRIRWSMEIPGLRRVNMPRDGGNWCADPTSLFLAHSDDLWRLDSTTGALVQSYQVPATPESCDWGYIATAGDKIYGSSVKKGSFYTKFSGSWEFWYDSTSAASEISKICSHKLFCLAKDTGAPVWEYSAGVVINTTICMGGGRIYFIDCRNPTILASDTGRIGSGDLWTQNHMVALDAATGALVWEQPLDAPVSPTPVVFYLCWADNALFLLSSTNQYNALGYRTSNGAKHWSKSYSWGRNHHGAHIYHPVVLGQNVIAEPNIYNIHTGALVKSGLPLRAGCSTMSGAANSVQYLHSSYNNDMRFWNPTTNASQQIRGLRSSCWLSIVSGDGMVFLPAASAGCACSFPIQTTAAFAAPD